MTIASHGAAPPAGPDAIAAAGDPTGPDPDASLPVQPLVGDRSWRDRLYPEMPVGGWRGWLGPIIVTAIAAALRLPNLGRPRAFAFDETYYAKDALSLLRFGTEQQMKTDANQYILNSNGDPWTIDPFGPGASFVVHPPFGKWVIAAGEAVFGVNPLGWRVAVVIVGLLSVLMVARITRRLLRSNLWGTVAGGLMAVDGLAIVMSRTAVLDIVLMACALAAFGCLLIDRDQTRRRLARELPADVDPASLWTSKFGPRIGAWAGARPWRLAAAVFLGLGCGVKWSGIWFVVAFGLLTVLWDVGLRKAIGVARPWMGTFLRDAIPAGLSMVAIVILTYLATWSGWFIADTGYYRNWAATAGPSSFSFVPDALRSLLHYHAEALNFHTHLTSPHAYQANAWGWPVQARPTSFFYEEAKTCGAARCSQEVLSLGNPLIWWGGLLAILHQTWRWAARRDWRSGAVLAGFVAGWAPWLMFQQRTVFEFYAIAFLPFVIMALTMSLGAVYGPARATERRRITGTVLVLVFLVAVIGVTYFFYPILTAQSLPYSQWHWRMWFPSWV